MTRPDDGGPAFPRPSTGMHVEQDGMSIRDYFAAQIAAAMVGTIHTDGCYERAREVARDLGYDRVSEWFAADAYKQADAMLAERAKGTS